MYSMKVLKRLQNDPRHLEYVKGFKMHQDGQSIDDCQNIHQRTGYEKSQSQAKKD